MHPTTNRLLCGRFWSLVRTFLRVDDGIEWPDSFSGRDHLQRQHRVHFGEEGLRALNSYMDEGVLDIHAWQ